MGVVFGVNGGIGGSEEAEKAEDQAAGVILKPKCVRVGVLGSQLAKKTPFTGKEIAEYICKTYALEAARAWAPCSSSPSTATTTRPK